MGVLIKITQIRRFPLRIDRCMIGNVTFSNLLLPLKEKHDLHTSYKAGVPFFAWHELSCKEARSFLQTEDYGAFGWVEADYAFKHDRKEICKNTPEHFELE